MGTISLWATSRTTQVQFLWYLAVKNELEEKTKEQELGSKTLKTKGEEVGGFGTERKQKKNKNRKEE